MLKEIQQQNSMTSKDTIVEKYRIISIKKAKILKTGGDCDLHSTERCGKEM